MKIEMTDPIQIVNLKRTGTTVDLTITINLGIIRILKDPTMITDISLTTGKIRNRIGIENLSMTTIDKDLLTIPLTHSKNMRIKMIGPIVNPSKIGLKDLILTAIGRGRLTILNKTIKMNAQSLIKSHGKKEPMRTNKNKMTGQIESHTKSGIKDPIKIKLSKI